MVMLVQREKRVKSEMLDKEEQLVVEERKETQAAREPKDPP